MTGREGFAIPEIGLHSVRRPCEQEIRRAERSLEPRVRNREQGVAYERSTEI